MLYDNHVQALDILNTEQATLNEGMASLQISSTDLLQWYAKEKEYIVTLGQELDKNIQAVAYVELLQKLAAAEYVSSYHLQ